MSVQTVHEHGQIDTLVNRLLQDLQSNVEMVFRRFDEKQFSLLVTQVLQSSGNVFFTGVGKSGVIAKKIAMTFSCSGTKAFYLSPQNALHGDIGVIGKHDMIFLLSKSGETAELIELCPALRNKGAHLVAVVMNGSSRLAKACQTVFVLPEVKELCPFDLSPTTSTIAQLIFGDLLAMTLMRLKGVSFDDFIQNHPAGRIGKRRLLKVRDLMISGKGMPTCGPHDILGNVLVELSHKQCGCVCVVDEKLSLLGIFTDGDMKRAFLRSGPAALGTPMETLMTRTPRSVSPDVLAYEALCMMESDQQRPITVLPVVEGKTCIGLLKMHDILQSGV